MFLNLKQLLDAIFFLSIFQCCKNYGYPTHVTYHNVTVNMVNPKSLIKKRSYPYIQTVSKCKNKEKKNTGMSVTQRE